MHGLFLVVMWRLCKGKEQDNGALLPVAFRSVLYLDGFGHDVRMEDSQDDSTGQSQARGSRRRGDQPEANDEELGLTPSPALQAVRYDSESNAPVPQRPEDLAPPGAAEDMRNVPGVPQVRGDSTRTNPEDEDYWDPSSFLAGPPPPEDTQADEYPREVTPPLRTIDEMVDTFHPVVTGHQKTNPSILPERTFKCAMAVLSLAWICAGLFAVLESTDALDLDRQYSHVQVKGEVPWVWEPSIQDMKAHAMRGLSGRLDATESRFHGPSMVQMFAYGFTGEHLFSGMEQIPVAWPYANFEPHGLACDSTGLQLAVMDHLSIFTADLKSVNGQLSSSTSWLRSTSNQTAAFVEVPCTALEGEGLQDLQMACDKNG